MQKTANSRKCLLKTRKNNVTHNSIALVGAICIVWPSFENVVWEAGPVQMCISGLYVFNASFTILMFWDLSASA